MVQTLLTLTRATLVRRSTLAALLPYCFVLPFWCLDPTYISEYHKILTCFALLRFVSEGVEVNKCKVVKLGVENLRVMRVECREGL